MKRLLKCYVDGSRSVNKCHSKCPHAKWHTLKEHNRESTCGSGYCMTRTQIQDAETKKKIEQKGW